MTTAIHKDNLPRPGSWDEVRGQRLTSTQHSGGMVFGAEPDSEVRPRVVTLGWHNCRREVVDAIWSHYRSHCAETFWLDDPRTADALVVRWLGPPTIRWTSPVSASVTGDVEVALAHE